MKQKVGFLDTEIAKFLKTNISFIVSNAVEILLGLIWVVIGWLFIMYFYKYCIEYYKKAVIEDRKEFKEVYRTMEKSAR